MSEPAAKTATTTGIYCQQCGYDLRASKEGGRCPECGRVFSPGDPKTFRSRPFAAPWKRALARWAKRLVILLLVLVTLLAGAWGWLYWGWKEERAALAQVGCKPHPPDPWFLTILGGEWGLRLHDRRVPGSFVLERSHTVVLPPTATDLDLRPLRKFSQLEVLVVQAPISGAGLAQLRPCPRLRRLWVSGPRITDAGLATLPDLPRLESLELTDTALAGPGLARLAAFPRLQKLLLDRAPLTDAGLAHLAPLGKLAHLSLAGTRVTDAGLVHLEKLTALRTLYLNFTQVTPAGKARLRAALPGCTIVGP